MHQPEDVPELMQNHTVFVGRYLDGSVLVCATGILHPSKVHGGLRGGNVLIVRADCDSASTGL